MKVLVKSEFQKLLEDENRIRGGVVFAEYDPDVMLSDVMVTEYKDSGFGATNIIPNDGEVFSFDWNIGEYKEDDNFIIFDNNDILQMIQTLTSCIEIPLRWE